MNRIKELRKKRGLTQRELGELSGLSNQAISFYEKGKRHPQMLTWQRMADVLGVSVSYLAGIDEQDHPHTIVDKLGRPFITAKDLEQPLKKLDRNFSVIKVNHTGYNNTFEIQYKNVKLTLFSVHDDGKGKLNISYKSIDYGSPLLRKMGQVIPAIEKLLKELKNENC